MTGLLHALKRFWQSAPPAQDPWARVYPFELYTWIVLLASVVFLRSRGLRVDWRTVEYTIYPMFKMLPLALGIGLGLQVLYRALGAGGPRRVRLYVRQVLTWQWFLLWFRLWFACMLMTYIYFWVKVCVPLVRLHLHDPAFWQLDVSAHLGFSPTLFVLELFKDSPIVPWIDRWYSLWITTVIWSMAFFCAATESSLRRRFALSCCLLWTLGSWLYMGLPALGPIYAFPELWRDTLGEMPGAEGVRLVLWDNYQKMVAGRMGPLRQFNPTRGIAAMPSLHVAAHWLFALWVRRTVRPLFVLFALGTAITVVGSVLTGWHYAIDAYVGILLAYACYRIALWWEKPTPRGDEAATSEPASLGKPEAPPVARGGAEVLGAGFS